MSFQGIQQCITNFFSGLYQVVSNAVSSICSRVTQAASRVFGRNTPSEPSQPSSLATRTTVVESAPQQPRPPHEEKLAGLSNQLDKLAQQGREFGQWIDGLPEGTEIPLGGATVEPIHVISGKTVNGR